MKLVDLIEPILGHARAIIVAGMLDLPDASREPSHATRADIAYALNMVLFSGLLERVPTGAAYVGDVAARGDKIQFDHGALRTVVLPSGFSSTLPNGHLAFARILKPLGYQIADIYPLPKLRMTGYAFRHQDAPQHIPQFFVSELHVDQFPEGFASAAERVFSDTHDPIDRSTQHLLDKLAEVGFLAFDDATALICDLNFCFDRHHGAVRQADYELLLDHSAEAAWMATEGNAFNHVTDRVVDIRKLVRAQKALGRPIKDKIEISAQQTVLQTAFRADPVTRAFIDSSGNVVEREVPGSFYEFISRKTDPATGEIDLRFDTQNAQGIFAMTAVAA
jgi:hypothetical protein